MSLNVVLRMLCKTNLSYDGQRSDDVCFSRRDLSQREHVGESVTSADDKWSNCAVEGEHQWWLKIGWIVCHVLTLPLERER